MKFRNPKATKIIEGRFPKKDEDFYEDRFYCDDIENVFVRFDPYKDYVRVIFPCLSEFVLKISYDEMEKLAKTDAKLLDLINAAFNVDDVSTEPCNGYIPFSDENPKYFLKFNNK